MPSRFIGEIPPEHVEQLSGGMVRSGRTTGVSWSDEVAAILGNVAPTVSESRFAKGERIFHQKFGYGRICAISGNTLEIDFEKAGSKKLLADFVEKT